MFIYRLCFTTPPLRPTTPILYTAIADDTNDM